jgi:hypothetical protein
MPAFTTGRAPERSIAEHPETYSGALAHILHKGHEKTSVLGQAWLVAPNRLVTCGHVVQPYLDHAETIVVKFPATGHEYPIDSVQVHPEFMKEAGEGFVKFDAAVVSLRMREPDISARCLPLCFDVELRPQQTLWTLRYPAHLGAISASPDALSQRGHYLGHLRKNDNYHLLHDLGLSPGDSGAPLFIEDGVVGLHCGDTASLPGLNLPTTTIRLGLLSDALRDMGLSGRSVSRLYDRRLSRGGQITLFILVTLFTVVLGVGGILAYRLGFF